jgi:hypothetical protein
MTSDSTPPRPPPNWSRFSRRALIAVIVLIGAVSITLGVLLLRSDQDEGESDVDGPITGSGATNPIEEFVRERMQPASAAFFAPSPMQRGQPSEVVLESSPASVSPDQLERELRARTARDGVGASDSIMIAPRMIARLVSDGTATITAKDAEDRAVKLGERVAWRWLVIPKAGGSLTLTAILTAPVILEGRETGFEVTSFDRTVTVTVTTQDRFRDSLDGVRQHWQLLATVGAGLLVVVRWGGRRLRKRRAAGFRPGR